MTTIGGAAAAAATSVDLLEASSPIVETIWRALERGANPPYFLTWGWMSTWLSCLPLADAPRLAVVRLSGAPAAAFFLSRRPQLRHMFVPSRALYVNVTGRPSLDELTLEHNAFLCSPPALSLASVLAALPDDWDEIVLPALSRDAFPGRALAEPLPGHVVRIDGESSAPYVDLAKVRAAPGG